MNDKVFIVCIELNSKHVADRIENYIRSFSIGYKKIIENVFAVRVANNYSSENIRDMINMQLGGNSTIFVMKSSIDAAWKVLPEIDGWLKSYI
ncbi:hypothetical protein [Phocaeicola coprophilus]